MELTTRHPAVTWALRYLTYPVIMIGALGTSITLAGTSFPPLAVIAMTTAFAVVVTAVVERVQPYYESWNRSRKDVFTDLISGAIVLVVIARMVEPILFAAFYWLSVSLSRTVGITFWPTGWHPAAQAALALVVGEFFYYWLHRWIHGSSRFWRFHAVHHSSERLYWLNSVRFHPVDFLLDDMALILPLALTGWTLTQSGLQGALILLTFYNAHGATMHSNMDIRLGPLNYLVPGPEMHRWHHSKNMDEANSNFGGKIMFYDWMFGTLLRPNGRRPPEDIGLAGGVELPTSYPALLVAPFRYSRFEQAAEDRATVTGADRV
jgi:sterol desaturase/sphingolipid hydroxylase (fatty acid hydroxylase superfamily)